MSLPQYMLTDLPQYVHITDRSKFQNSIVQPGAALIFSQDGASLTVKLPSGIFQSVSGDMSDSTYQDIMDIIGVSDSSVYAQSDSVSVGSSIIQISPNGTGSIKIVQASGPVTVTFDQYTAQQFTTFPVTIEATSDTTSIKIQGDVLSLDCSTVPLVALDASNHTTLQILNVNSCGLSTLTVTGCSQLNQIFATENSLTSLTLTGTPMHHLTISENSLTASVMDQILIYLNALDTLGGAAYMTDQTTGAVPTAAGYTAKSQLQSRGWTVQVGSQGVSDSSSNVVIRSDSMSEPDVSSFPYTLCYQQNQIWLQSGTMTIVDPSATGMDRVWISSVAIGKPGYCKLYSPYGTYWQLDSYSVPYYSWTTNDPWLSTAWETEGQGQMTLTIFDCSSR